jgi:hypothetical protein
MMHDVTIARRFRGPTHSGNGGYVCGLLAACFADDAREAPEITLRTPPPLEKPLQLQTQSGPPESATLSDGDTLIAQAQRIDLQLECPAAPDLELAAQCSRNFVGFETHAFPECFVCGPARAPADGLCIFPGTAPDGSVIAPFIPDPSLPSTNGNLDVPLVWAALDCPGYFGAAHGETALLGRMSARIVRAVKVSMPHVVRGWSQGREGRKLFAATALYDAQGVLCAYARQTWIVVRA